MTARTNDVEISRIRSAYSRREQSGLQRRYSLSEPGNILRIEEVHRRMQFLIAAHLGPDLSTKRILEVGCGTGYWLRQFIQWGARPENLFGTDLLPERIEKARELCPQGVHLECGDASKLNFEDETFDLAAQVTVFTSILDDAMKTAVASEIQRVLKPRGWLLWYDYVLDNPRNPDVRGIRKKELVHLFPGFDVHMERVTVAPPLGRILGGISPLAYQMASSIKVFCTHRLGLMQKKMSAENSRASR